MLRIAIVGAGGVGGYYGGLLARAGHEVVMLARGAHLDALRSRGIEVRDAGASFVADVAATDDPESIGRVDFALVAVKNYSLPEVAPALRLLAERGADILPLLNGVEVVDHLVGLGVPADRILGGLTAISAVKVGPGVVEKLSKFQRVVLGEVEGGPSDRAERIGSAFREAGVEVEIPPDLAVATWRKFAFIASLAAACGLARSPVGPLRSTPLGRLMIGRAVREAIAVARALGVAMPEGEEEGILRYIDGLKPDMKPSFLLDLEAGSATEIDDLSGAISRLGRKAGVETPVHDTATAALGGGGEVAA